MRRKNNVLLLGILFALIIINIIFINNYQCKEAVNLLCILSFIFGIVARRFVKDKQ